MSISEYDVVRLKTEIPTDRVNRSVSQRLPQIGDLGAVVFVYDTQPQNEAFCVECVGQDGRTIWLADIFASELEQAPAKVGGA